ncbi:MAG TPA: hypothetical protein VGE74_21030 [Gemmata sp.]
MAKDMEPPNPDDDPLADGGDEDDPKYTAHLKVPLEFMERLEDIANKINRRRKRTGRRKRALGWFVVNHLKNWMNRAEAELNSEKEKGDQADT